MVIRLNKTDSILLSMKDTSTICKNCGTSADGKYCHQCGQSTAAGRINFHYIIHEIQHSIFHVDKGILYTIKELLVRPGSTIRGYLEGKRVGLFKPFGFIVILSTVYGLIAHFFEVYPEDSISHIYSDGEEYQAYTQLLNEWVYSHYSLVMLFFTPFFAFGSYTVFIKYKYNYMEHLVLCSYIVGIQVFINTLAYFLFYFTQSVWVVTAVAIMIYIYHVWVYVQFFNEYSRLGTILKTILAITFSFIIIMCLFALLSALFVFFNHFILGHTMPE